MNNKSVLVVLMTLAICVGCATQQPSVEYGPDARKNSEGLHFVNNTVFDEAWFQPAIDMQKYNKILIMNAGIHFNDVRGSKARARDIEEQRSRFEDILTEAFRTELAKLKSFEIVQEAGPGVLLMHGAVTNIDLIEPTAPFSRERVFARNFGAASLVIDLRDSLTGEGIIMAKDRQAIKSAGREFSRVTDQTTWQAVRKLSKGWASLLRDRLDLLAGYRLSSQG